MICEVCIEGTSPQETEIRPISSQTEPVCNLELTIKLYRSRESPPKQILKKSTLWKKEFACRRKMKLTDLCKYLSCKVKHCIVSSVTNPAVKKCNNGEVYKVKLSCNLEWLISVIETEIDYNLGKKTCAKKYNELFMQEYMATQLSGFGEKFYCPDANISNSIIGRLYKMEVDK